MGVRRGVVVLGAAAALAAVTLGVALLVPGVGLAGGGAGSGAGGDAGSPAGVRPAGSPSAEGSGAGAGVAVLAFAGDVHFEGSSRAALTAGLGSAATVLADADVAVVNLETAITGRGTRQPKQYAFRAPEGALATLRDAGVDAVSLANNHGMDFGRIGLQDTLAAARRAGLPVIGAGRDAAQAFAAWRTTVNGVRVAVLAATDVLDDFALATWPATATRPGLASAKDPARLLAAVRAARREADVVAVVLHWGVELRACPTPRQRDLARRLTAAGAAVVVGSHAHVLGPSVRSGRTAVHYGLGNFVFYATGASSTRSGVFTVRVDRRGVLDTAWSPAVIRGGRPALLASAEKAKSVTLQTRLATQCAVSGGSDGVRCRVTTLVAGGRTSGPCGG